MKQLTVTVVIPARLGSTRFAGKLLYPFRDKPLLYYVWKEASKSKHIDHLIIATDSSQIEREAIRFGAEVVRTSKRHRTGSDRAAEVAPMIGGDIVVNLQGDNFGLKSAVLDRLIDNVKQDSKIGCATLARRIDSDDELFDSSTVKVVGSKDGNALWFSRSPIPFLAGRDDIDRTKQFGFMKHIGVYVFRKKMLQTFAGLKRSPYEKAESLEQLRLLENGYPIRLFTTTARPVSIDSPSDIAKIDTLYK